MVRVGTSEAIVTQGLSLRYPGFDGSSSTHAVRDVDLRICRGEMVAVVGPSGSGKSSCLHCLSGLETGWEGEIRLVGQRLRQRQLSPRRRAREVGFVFQDYLLLDFLTARENVLLVEHYAGRSRQSRARLDHLFTMLGISDVADRPAANLSGGQRQRVAVARAMINRPGVIFADEPTGALDGHNARLVLAGLREACAEGSAVVLVTHDLEVACQADRAIVMVEGAKVAELGSPMPAELFRYMRKLGDTP